MPALDQTCMSDTLLPSADSPKGLNVQVCAGQMEGLNLAWGAHTRVLRHILGVGVGPRVHRPCPSLSLPGTYVTRAEATDADDPETDNAALRYSILEQGGPQLFSIDEHTGDIRTVQVGLDREVRPPVCHRRWRPGRPGSRLTSLCPPCWPSEPDGGSSLQVGPPAPALLTLPQEKGAPFAADTHSGFGHKLSWVTSALRLIVVQVQGGSGRPSVWCLAPTSPPCVFCPKPPPPCCLQSLRPSSRRVGPGEWLHSGQSCSGGEATLEQSSPVGTLLALAAGLLCSCAPSGKPSWVSPWPPAHLSGPLQH